MDDAGHGRWVSRPEAAALVGCPVTTVDWYARCGAIESRPRRGRRPTLLLSSVEVFAVEWRSRPTDRAGRRMPQRRTVARPAGRGWLGSGEVAARLGFSRTHVGHLIGTGVLPARRFRGRWWVRERDVDRFAAARGEWISFAAAAELTGLAHGILARAARDGLIEQRRVVRARPSLARASVLAWQQARADKEARRAAEKATAERARAENVGPPRDGDVRLDTATAALVLGVSDKRVRQWAAADRLPSTRRGGRLWFRRGHVEQYAAARAWVLHGLAPRPR